jgi:tol-pal system protein YbgF
LALSLLLASLACAGGFSTVQPKTQDPEVSALRQQNLELRKRATVSEVEVARLRQELGNLRAELNQRAEAVQARAGRGAGTVISDEDPAQPTGTGTWRTIEESDLAVENLEAENTVADPYAGATAARAAPMSAPDPNDPQKTYDSGYTLFHQRRYSESELQFQRFLDLYPENELSDNALFWIGESRYAMGDYPGALEAFTNTVQRYPSGNKVTDALLKAGKCFEAMQDLERAKDTYRELDRLFPESAAAVAARERLANLGS